jgi:hypothetical protein
VLYVYPTSSLLNKKTIKNVSLTHTAGSNFFIAFISHIACCLMRYTWFITVEIRSLILLYIIKIQFFMQHISSVIIMLSSLFLKCFMVFSGFNKEISVISFLFFFYSLKNSSLRTCFFFIPLFLLIHFIPFTTTTTGMLCNRR